VERRCGRGTLACHLWKAREKRNRNRLLRMALQFRKPILYLITRGASKPSTTSKGPEFQAILTQVSAAVAAGIDLIQIREKNLSARVLFELCEQAVRLTTGTATKLLVNDREDIAAGAAAQRLHLTTR